MKKKETKKKGSAEPEDVEYVLSPIYAPFFHISYRKGRKLKLKTDDVLTLTRGTYEDVKELLKRFSGVWAIELSKLTPTLFSHLGQS